MKGIIKKSTAFKKKFAAVMLLAIMLVSVFGAAAEQGTIVTLQYDNNLWTFATDAETIGEFFSAENIAIKDNDYVNYDLSAPVEDGMNIVVKVAKYITIHENGGTYGGTTYESTVMDALTSFGISLPDYDGCYPERGEAVYDGSHIWLVRAKQVTFTRGGSTLNYYTHAQTVGDFLNEINVAVRDDEKVSPEKSASLLATNSVKISDKVNAMSPLDFGIDLSTARVITCEATAYTPSIDECGKDDGITATGAKCEVGVVAVDPRVIPLGTKLYIETLDGSFVYGYCSAQDTGGAIKGNKVDLAMNTKSECFQFGRRKVKVYILS